MMEMKQLLGAVHSTVKYGGYLDCTTLDLSKAMELCGVDGTWENAIRREIYRAWSEDIRNAEGFWVDKKVSGGLIFNKEALAKNKDVFIRFLSSSQVEQMEKSLERADRQINSWNALIKAYRKCTGDQLRKWNDILEHEEQSEDRDIELCIIHAEMEHRKIFNRIWGIVWNTFLKIKNNVQCRMIAAYIRE